MSSNSLVFQLELVSSESHFSSLPPGGAHQSADLLLPVGGRASCGFDHGGGLVVGQLLDTALAHNNVAHLRRNTAGGKEGGAPEEKHSRW